MFEFLPDWFKAVIGCGVILAILIAGFVQTSNKANKNNKSGDNK